MKNVKRLKLRSLEFRRNCQTAKFATIAKWWFKLTNWTGSELQISWTVKERTTNVLLPVNEVDMDFNYKDYRQGGVYYLIIKSSTPSLDEFQKLDFK